MEGGSGVKDSDAHFARKKGSQERITELSEIENFVEICVISPIRLPEANKIRARVF